MNDEEILSLAKFAYNEAKTKDFRGKMKPLEMWMVSFIIEFHSLIQNMEREACAKLCDEWQYTDGERLSIKIRARGQE